MPQIDKLTFFPVLFWFFIIFFSTYFFYFLFALLPLTNYFKLKFKKTKFYLLKTAYFYNLIKRYNQRKIIKSIINF